MCYTISFAHTLVPHYHTEEWRVSFTGEIVDDGHHHHSHDHHEAHHEHHGVVDLLACLYGELEHHHVDDCVAHDYVPEESSIKLSDREFLKVVIFLKGFFLPEFSSESKPIEVNRTSIHKAPDPGVIPLRGPPSHSC